MTTPLNQYDEIALAVGRVAIQAAWVEYYAALLAAELIGAARAEVYVFGQTWSATYDGLRALIKDRVADAVDDAEGRTIDIPFYRETLGHLAKANELMTQRGNVVHALWS